MKTRIKHSLASVLALVLALAMAVPAFAADPQEGGEGQTQPPVAETETGNTGASDKTGTGEETTGDEQAPADTTDSDGYTVVTTAEQLLTALNNGTAKIQFGNDIDVYSPVTISKSVEIDLNNHTWCDLSASDRTTLIIGSDSDETGISVKIHNGWIDVGGQKEAIRQQNSDLILTNLRIDGGYTLMGGATGEINSCTITRSSEDTLDGDAIMFGGYTYASLRSIKNSKISSSTIGIGGDGTVQLLENSIVHGDNIGLCSFVTSINNSTVTGGEIGIRVTEPITIQSITVGPDNYISSIEAMEYDLDGTHYINGGTIGDPKVENSGLTVLGHIGSISNITISHRMKISGSGTVDSISGCKLCPLQMDGGNIQDLDNCEIDGIYMPSGEIDTIQNCTITSLPESYGPGFIGNAISIGSSNPEYPDEGTINNIIGCTIEGQVFLRSGDIGTISGNTITAEDGNAIVNYGSIETIGSGNTITIPMGSPSGAQYVAINNFGTIDSIEGNAINGEAVIFNQSGRISEITGNTLTAGDSDGAIVNTASIGTIEDNVITSEWRGIYNYGVNTGVDNVTIGRISGNRITSENFYAIINAVGTISELEDNELSSGAEDEGYHFGVMNDGGLLHITADGVLSSVPIDVNGEMMDLTVFFADAGWMAANSIGTGGTITHEEEPDYPDIPVDPPIRPTDPVEPEEPEEPDETTETVTNPDGSTTTTVTDNTTGTVTETTQYENGVALEIVTSAEGDRDISVTVPSGVTQATVTIPMDQVGLGTVAVDAATGEVVKQSIPSESGLSVTLDASAQLIVVDNTKNFADTAAHWAGDAITFVTARELFNGISDTTFAADLPMSRAMLTTVLARLEGVDTTTGSTWYEAGMSWAVEQGISDGSAPDSDITREDLYTMLYRYAGSPAVSGGLSGYPDGSTVSDYAQSAMAWAVETGLCTGTGAGTLDPQGDASRAQVATILMRFMTL